MQDRTLTPLQVLLPLPLLIPLRPGPYPRPGDEATRAEGPAPGSLPLPVLASLLWREQPGPDVVGNGPQPIKLDGPPKGGVDLSQPLG